MELFEKTISSKSIYEGKVISLRLEDVELPDGQIAKRELIKHPGAVAILPITEEGKIVFVQQFRKALERTLVEIPAGKIEPEENKKHTAIRELEEETGYRANQFEFIQSFATSPGFADEVIHLYLAKQLEKVDHPALGDEDEFIDILECTIQEAEQLVADGRVFDAKTLYAILYAKNMK
ncbi:NUDIX hydrolase [Sporosarcina sp. Te-1]|uniref:NUDIX hydrolase n=1 Tax=Sporosarcina sp. Te-1 TaxID=2818390 RepID=UPI001A9E9DA1|nr:NUDIX hydrolase [Sporosarcina sp. Te-1]QTD42227.1 NUDIX hydrolase [Sporosarcina sp. Te-1]